MFRNKQLIAVLVLALSLAFASAAFAASDTDGDAFALSVVNPYVVWDSTFSSGSYIVNVEPGMDRQYTVYNSITVASTTNMVIEVKAEWLGGATLSSIRMNRNNNVVTGVNDRNKAFDIQLSRRNQPNQFGGPQGVPSAAVKTWSTGNTLGHTNDAATFGVRVTLVLVDEAEVLAGGYNTSGYDSGGRDNSRFENLPNGSYEVSVTVTVTENI